ncbi:MAG: nucleotidyl transferase [Erysipelotrichaceae bacterium]|nr:MAG: nucleotidyl [Erysipelotrichaceae bacterium]TXT18474.1 MAG: nucleotidyl transferase [Erysipelotrichaceae bacterium]
MVNDIARLLNLIKIKPNVSVREAIISLVNGKKKTIFIVDDEDKLIGLFTNGDMRRYLLQGKDLSVPISEAMNVSPVCFKTRHEADLARSEGSFVIYPIVNDNGVLTDALFERESPDINFINSELSDIPLVIMAGGKGTRLHPYTKILPKALIPIGDYTITERIISTFEKFGCSEVHMILNHKANMIRAYFNDLKKDYSIDFVQEESFLGTAGGLYLLKDKLKSTFFMSNCDILINDDLACVYHTHVKDRNAITFVCSIKTIEIPYGVISTNDSGRLLSIDEKPKYSHFVNTGVYVIEPEVFKYLKEGEFIHITDLAIRCSNAGERVGVFPISENSWLDMGEFKNMEEMLKEFEI